MSTQRQVRRGTTAEIASMSTPAEGEWLYDTTRKAGVWGDGAEDDGIPSPNFAEVINNTWTGFTAVQNGSPADPNDLTITIDERFNKAAFLNGATFKTFARFYVKIPANNTGAVNLTVEFGSGGSTITKDLKKIDAAAAPAELEADDLIEGGVYSVVFDGTQWLVVGGLGGGGGGLTLISSVEASNDAQIDFTGLSGYAYLMVVLGEVVPASSLALLRVRVSQSSTFITSSSYVGAGWYYQGAVAFANFDQGSATQLEPDQVGVSAGRVDNRNGLSGVFEAFEIDETSNVKKFRCRLQQYNVGGRWTTSDFGGAVHSAAGAIDGLRFFFSTGNIASGRFSLYGIET